MLCIYMELMISGQEICSILSLILKQSARDYSGLELSLAMVDVDS